MYIIKTVLFFTALLVAGQPCAQPDTAARAQINGYYQQAMQYKNGSGVAMDYTKAVYYFSRAAQLGDAQSTYALAYMQYKGLGCTQDYAGAATLFAQGAAQGKDNSMYFYGLCWRNGYGLAKNEDSAKYWLQRSADLGYKQAVQELLMKTAENGSDSAKALVQQISNAARPNNAVLNRYKKIDNHLPPADVVAGNYTGYLIQYDWSGQNAVSTKKLALNLAKEGNGLVGGWTEEGTDSVALRAVLKYDSIVFRDTKYGRKDHYSPEKAVRYNFNDARLNLVQKGDTVFLAGNVGMFSPDRGEPSKPLFVALARVDERAKNPGIGLRVSPNPFTTTLNVEFTIPKDAEVEVQLLNAGGAIVYRNPAGTLVAGHYLLPLQPGYIAPGVYLVKLVYGYRSEVVKVVRGG